MSVVPSYNIKVLMFQTVIRIVDFDCLHQPLSEYLEGCKGIYELLSTFLKTGLENSTVLIT